ncbi:small GTP-binding protein, putative [Trichomonas vaginalis G3]|uniref:Small GTP-binding protein, putative n=1 Tax=Trichomonas vaginalis (strain ATCC PRA-98 / G3) TaxID=412133 RepID=A2E7J8_TRIV3|nr:GTPase protein [Trichomonas vaginalis G3]EAY11391.1 small GTP-binding protein, putative [Trichomonas vaginalis G3]KAI5530556.1 GTPase protein [Trichomonas vaginalis G3]|eukprot:XP_001323614.1 small GTP-binding protein [Trichomonas vaginalis G3]
MKDLKFKICFIGSSSVGKSAIARVLRGEDFINDCQPTIGVDNFAIKQTVDGEEVTLMINDTAGQEKFRSISKAYFRNAVGALVVFDVKDRQSFDAMDVWINDFNQMASPNAVILLVGNKIDLPDRIISQEEAEEFALRHNAKYIETSAKTGANIQEAISKITIEITKGVKEGIIKIKEDVKSELDPSKDQVKKGCC